MATIFHILSHMLTIIFIDTAYIQEEELGHAEHGSVGSGAILQFCLPQPVHRKHRNGHLG